MSHFNVRAFGATGNGTTDDSLAIRNALAAAATNGGTVFLPDGTYLVSASSYNCLSLPNGVTLAGESRTGTTIQFAAGDPGSGRLIYIATSDAAVSNLTLDGNKANQSVDQHRCGIFVASPAQRVRVENICSQNSTGDGITINGGSDLFVLGSYMTANNRDGITLDGGGSTFRVTIRDCQCVGNAQQQIDCEPPDGPLQDVTIDGCWLAGGGVSTSYVLQIEGQGADSRSIGYNITNNRIDGSVYGCWADNVTFTNNRITSSGASPAVEIYRTCNNWTVANNQIELTEGSTATTAVFVQGVGGGTLDAPDKLAILGNQIVVNNNGGGIYVATVAACRIEGNEIIGSDASADNHGVFGVQIRATLTNFPIKRISVRSNFISNFFYAIDVSGDGSGTYISDMDVSHNLFEGVSPNGMATAISWDADGMHSVQQATCIGNSCIGLVDVPIVYTYPNVPMLIGGIRGAAGMYSLVGPPSGVITWEQPGAIAVQRDGTSSGAMWILSGGSTWLKVAAS